ncbi:hypothetical protein PAHAL_1G350400 [Panicum hallii]|uniref:Uncharacterized protein n=1 Tax=Panicum hallii TaxID=206008 RepID=A0A2T8KXA0_9POAL|nr:hypothetical protein PAHAL_1G350400 [Panicum hallii]
MLASASRRWCGGAGEGAVRGSISGEQRCVPCSYAPQATLMVHGHGFLASTPWGVVLPVMRCSVFCRSKLQGKLR